ncbi:hypothetical protein BDN72DRAFT_865977, partial [Pluteus cervinus]
MATKAASKVLQELLGLDNARRSQEWDNLTVYIDKIMRENLDLSPYSLPPTQQVSLPRVVKEISEEEPYYFCSDKEISALRKYICYQANNERHNGRRKRSGDDRSDDDSDNDYGDDDPTPTHPPHPTHPPQPITRSRTTNLRQEQALPGSSKDGSVNARQVDHKRQKTQHRDSTSGRGVPSWATSPSPAPQPIASTSRHVGIRPAGAPKNDNSLAPQPIASTSRHVGIRPAPGNDAWATSPSPVPQPIASTSRHVGIRPATRNDDLLNFFTN